MRVVSADNLKSSCVESLGLDSSVFQLLDVESIACALRRAAAFLYPCTRRTLIRAVEKPLCGLYDQHETHDFINETLETLLAHGDLRELRGGSQDEEEKLLIHIAPPSFVCHRNGAVLILGVAPDAIPPLPEYLADTVEYKKHDRVIERECIVDQLTELGFIQRSLDEWTKVPELETPVKYLNRVKDQLAAATSSGEVEDLSLLDPKQPVNYYKGRWVTPSDQTGLFVSRRPQAYGADLWSFFEMDNGHPVRFVDLPLRKDEIRGCDEAWRLQAAIDFENGRPQIFRRRSASPETVILDFFSPVPMWATRRWDTVGVPVSPTKCLFSYLFFKRGLDEQKSDLDEELKFIKERLWLVEDQENSES